MPQVREPGAEAEVDFGDVTVELGGQLARCFMFAFRLSCSGKGVHRVYASQAQEAFLEGHVTAFEVTGGVPFRQIRYDNLSPGGGQGAGRPNRTETTRWLAFRAHYKSVPASSRECLVPGLPAGSELTWGHPGIGIDSNIL